MTHFVHIWFNNSTLKICTLTLHHYVRKLHLTYFLRLLNFLFLVLALLYLRYLWFKIKIYYRTKAGAFSECICCITEIFFKAFIHLPWSSSPSLTPTLTIFPSSFLWTYLHALLACPPASSFFRVSPSKNVALLKLNFCDELGLMTRLLSHAKSASKTEKVKSACQIHFKIHINTFLGLLVYKYPLN